MTDSRGGVHNETIRVRTVKQVRASTCDRSSGEIKNGHCIRSTKKRCTCGRHEARDELAMVNIASVGTVVIKVVKLVSL